MNTKIHERRKTMNTKIKALKNRAANMGYRISNGPFRFRFTLIEHKPNRLVGTKMSLKEIIAYLDNEAAGFWYETDADGITRKVG